jgi:Plasmid pRiA4b ORF-3-like protein
MARRWLSIRVDLIGGRGQMLNPRPGRSFAVPPMCTFDELGRAIDLAFARWDLSHLRQFMLEDGTLVLDEEAAEELRASAFGGGASPRTNLLSAKVGQQLKVGSRFRYIFDLGDDWTHVCTVESQLDPLEVLGDIPDLPTAYFGWGTIPDQYGRRWDADDGVSEPPAADPQEDEQLGWFTREPMPLINRTKFRIALASGQSAEVIDAVSAVGIETALQQVGTGLLKTYRTVEPAEQMSLSPVLISVQQRLQRRGWEGDGVLAAEMLAELHGEEPNGRPLPIDLDELSNTMADHGEYPGGYLNIETGEVVPAVATDAYAVGEQYGVDMEEGDWVHVLDDSREGADDRRWGRARQELADLGLRPA